MATKERLPRRGASRILCLWHRRIGVRSYRLKAVWVSFTLLLSDCQSYRM